MANTISGTFDVSIGINTSPLLMVLVLVLCKTAYCQYVVLQRVVDSKMTVTAL